MVTEAKGLFVGDLEDDDDTFPAEELIVTTQGADGPVIRISGGRAGYLVECEICETEQKVSYNFNPTNTKCITCNRGLYYPEGADW